VKRAGIQKHFTRFPLKEKKVLQGPLNECGKPQPGTVDLNPDLQSRFLRNITDAEL
jgi:hypothetical protein